MGPLATCQDVIGKRSEEMRLHRPDEDLPGGEGAGDAADIVAVRTALKSSIEHAADAGDAPTRQERDRGRTSACGPQRLTSQKLIVAA